MHRLTYWPAQRRRLRPQLRVLVRVWTSELLYACGRRMHRACRQARVRLGVGRNRAGERVRSSTVARTADRASMEKQPAATVFEAAAAPAAVAEVAAAPAAIEGF